MYDFNDAGPQIIPFSAYSNQAPAWQRGDGAVTETQKLIVGNEATLLQALGIDPYAKKHQTCPMPARHRNGMDLNPSFRFDLTRGKFYCTCEPRGGDILDIVEHTGRAHDKISACNWVRDQLGYPRIGEVRQETQQQREERERNLAEQKARAEEIARQRELEEAARVEQQHQKALSMWRRSVLIGGTDVPAYLASRGIECAPEFARYLPQTSNEYPQCMIVPFGTCAEDLRGVHVTYIQDGGAGKASDHEGLSKKTIGIGEDFPPLIVATVDGCDRLFISEGIEDALSAHQALECSAWAAGSAARLPGLVSHVPVHIKTVIIQQDDNASGRGGTAGLAAGLAQRGIAVLISEGVGKQDVNDVLRTEGNEGVRAYLAKARECGAPRQPVQLAIVNAPPASPEELEEMVARLECPPNALELGKILGLLVKAKLDPIAEQGLLGKIKTQSGVSMGALRDEVKALKKRLLRTATEGQSAWQAQLRRNMLGQPERNEVNVIIALDGDPAFAGAIVFDEFRQEITVLRPMPWECEAIIPRPWRDVDDTLFAEWLQRRDVNVAPHVVSRAVQAFARKHSAHPVREYLARLRWDGVKRLDKWTVTHLGADDNDLNGAFGAMWMLSAVARIMRPGCKADCAIILEGPQGARKSSALRTLAVNDKWFIDDLKDLSSKDTLQQICGAWIVEIAELDAMHKAEVTRIKAFLSGGKDKFRPPYGRYQVEIPRQCVFAGTVNPDTYLRDDTGNRRFWPIRCGYIDIGAIERDRDQLWAEAVHEFKAGRSWWLTDQIMISKATAAQEERREDDAWIERIDAYLRIDFLRDPQQGARRLEPLSSVTTGEVLEKALGMTPGQWRKADEQRATSCLKRLGFEKGKRDSTGIRAIRWNRVTTQKM